jgi:hypothetical protein
MARVSSEHELAVKHLPMAGPWHPTKSGQLTPHFVTSSSSKRISWLSPKDHGWQDTVFNRAQSNTGCPNSSGQSVCKENCLKTWALCLANQCHPNRNQGLILRNVQAGSCTRAWWICSRGRDWEARIEMRHRSSGCPLCYKEKTD